MSSANEINEIFLDAVAQEGKVEYLLNLDQENKEGKNKARFFRSLGFSLNNSHQFADAVTNHPKTAHLVEEKDTEWGKRFVFSCIIETPSGKNICIKSVWQIDKEHSFPRLITAYPEEE